MQKFINALLTIAVLLFLVPTAQAAHSAHDEAAAGRMVSARVESRPGRTTEMYKVPGGMELVVTQACVPHSAMDVQLGHGGSSITYRGSGCTKFMPGMRLGAGETLYCANRSGTSRDCMMIGMLRDDPDRGEGALFIDVDEALAAEE